MKIDYSIAWQDLGELDEGWQFFLQNIPDIVITVDRNGTILSLNRSISGFSVQETIGKAIYDYVSPMYCDAIKRCLEGTFQTGRPANYITLGAGVQGPSTVWYETRVIPIKREKKVIAAVLINRDITERKRIEEALQESEGKYSSLVEQAQEGVVILQDGVFKFCNKAMSKITGYSTGELMGMDFLPAIMPEHRELIKQRYEADISGKTSPKTFAIKTRRKDGNIIDIEVTGSSVCYHDRPAAMCVLRDITQRKKTEKALLESEEKYRSLVENVNIGVYRNTGGPHGHFLHANPAMAKMFGYDSVKEFRKTRVSDLYQNPKDRKVFIDEVLRKEFVKGKELRLRKKDGTPIWASCTARVQYDENGDIKWIDGVVEDITERKQAEGTLRQAEERYRMQFEGALDAIFVADAKTGILVDCNPAAAKLVEREKSELIGQHQRILHPPEKIIREFSKTFKQHLKEKQSQILETQVITKTGQIKDVAIKASLFEIRGRTIMQGIFRDITERKNAERELGVLNRQLLKSNKRLKQLALIDSQTGLYNHRFFEGAVDAEFYRAKRYGHSLSAIMLDIDYFKSINDVYGHHFGDLVLRQFAKLLKRMVRRYDLVIRFGGEEFIILSSGIDRLSGAILAQRLLDAVNLYNFGNKKHVVKLKLSIAVSSYPEDRIYRAMDLIELTDKILNVAKQCGGNRVYTSVDIKKRKQLDTAKNDNDTDIKFLREKIDRLTKRTNQSLIEAIFAFAKTIELKDRYTGEHVERMARYSTSIARALNLSKDEIEHIRQASILHDLGKIGISERVLLKKSKLNRKEFEQIKKHPQIGVDIIRPIHFLHIVIPLILYHHERWDGRGYPNGLKGEEIPIGARVISIADVFEALTSDRPYRKAYSKVRAVRIIQTGAGRQFDPRIVNTFLKILQKEKDL